MREIWIGKQKQGCILAVKGRLTRTIFVLSGAKIYPQYMEGELSKVKGVQDVIICGVPAPETKSFFTPVCFVVPENMDNAEEVKSAVEQFCTMKFPEDSRPKRIFIKEHLPLNKGNKPDILSLEKEAAAAMEG